MSFDPISAGFDFASAVLQRVIPDPAARAAAEEKLLELKQAGDLAQLQADTQLATGQLDVNKAEAGNANWFVAGWRPFIGWVCGFALTYQFVVRAFLIYVPSLFHWKVDAPELNTQDLLAILTGMLGFGYLRTSEKKAGVATDIHGAVLAPVTPTPAPQPPQPVPTAAPAVSGNAARWAS